MCEKCTQKPVFRYCALDWLHGVDSIVRGRIQELPRHRIQEVYGECRGIIANGSHYHRIRIQVFKLDSPVPKNPADGGHRIVRGSGGNVDDPMIRGRCEYPSDLLKCLFALRNKLQPFEFLLFPSDNKGLFRKSRRRYVADCAAYTNPQQPGA